MPRLFAPTDGPADTGTKILPLFIGQMADHFKNGPVLREGLPAGLFVRYAKGHSVDGVGVVGHLGKKFCECHFLFTS